jgi:hypothetical protein
MNVRWEMIGENIHVFHDGIMTSYISKNSNDTYSLRGYTNLDKERKSVSIYTGTVDECLDYALVGDIPTLENDLDNDGLTKFIAVRQAYFDYMKIAKDFNRL